MLYEVITDAPVNETHHGYSLQLPVPLCPPRGFEPLFPMAVTISTRYPTDNAKVDRRESPDGGISRMREGEKGRITSYNVCYTKLLRDHLWPRKAGSAVDRAATGRKPRKGHEGKGNRLQYVFHGPARSLLF